MFFKFWFVTIFYAVGGNAASQFSKDENNEITKQGKLTFPPNDSPLIPPFRNKSLPIEERLDNLVSMLTLQEVIQQLSRGGANDNGPAPGIDRLQINPYNWNTECLHGYMPPGYATGFPSPVGIAATFNPQFAYKMGRAVALEARANFNNFTKHGYFGDHTGLSCFAPVVNIMRHPLWGRNQETYGEDPFLTSLMARSYVNGLQSTRQGYPGATAVCKHFGAYSGPENIPTSRFSFNAEVSEADLGNTFLQAFRQCVKAGAHGVMCSYNAINGVPACANKDMIVNKLRGKFGFKGYVVSDEGAIEHIDMCFNYTQTKLDTAVASKNSGVDLELTNYGRENRFSLLNQAVAENLVNEEDLRQSAKLLFKTRMILGEFDPPNDNPWNKVKTSEILSSKHIKLAKEIAANSYVLLKNDGTLPFFDILYGKAAIVGPFANNTAAVTGDYPTNPNGKYKTPADSMLPLFLEGVSVASGCVGTWDKELPLCKEYNPVTVQESIESADVVVVTIGTGTIMEAESRDRMNMSLPANQYKLVEDAVKFANGTPVLVLIYSAGPVAIDDIYASPGVNAILLCHFPGQEAGSFGDLLFSTSNSNLAYARLPYTWYGSTYSLSPITDYRMAEAGLTYRYIGILKRNLVLFPFGYGLSYGKFFYTNVEVEPQKLNKSSNCDDVKVHVTITNAGKFNSYEVVQVYREWQYSFSLVAFERVLVNSFSTKRVTLRIEPFALAVWDRNNWVEGYPYEYILESTCYELHVGGQQPGQRTKLASNILQASFCRGVEIPLSDCEK